LPDAADDERKRPHSSNTFLRLADGRRFRVLVIVDDFIRECLALVVDTSISGWGH
jgi:hypothetical protein